MVSRAHGCSSPTRWCRKALWLRKQRWIVITRLAMALLAQVAIISGDGLGGLGAVAAENSELGFAGKALLASTLDILGLSLTGLHSTRRISSRVVTRHSQTYFQVYHDRNATRFIWVWLVWRDDVRAYTLRVRVWCRL